MSKESQGESSKSNGQKSPPKLNLKSLHRSSGPGTSRTPKNQSPNSGPGTSRTPKDRSPDSGSRTERSSPKDPSPKKRQKRNLTKRFSSYIGRSLLSPRPDTSPKKPDTSTNTLENDAGDKTDKFKQESDRPIQSDSSQTPKLQAHELEDQPSTSTPKLTKAQNGTATESIISTSSKNPNPHPPRSRTAAKRLSSINDSLQNIFSKKPPESKLNSTTAKRLSDLTLPPSPREKDSSELPRGNASNSRVTCYRQTQKNDSDHIKNCSEYISQRLDVENPKLQVKEDGKGKGKEKEIPVILSDIRKQLQKYSPIELTMSEINQISAEHDILKKAEDAISQEYWIKEQGDLRENIRFKPSFKDKKLLSYELCFNEKTFEKSHLFSLQDIMEIPVRYVHNTQDPGYQKKDLGAIIDRQPFINTR